MRRQPRSAAPFVAAGTLTLLLAGAAARLLGRPGLAELAWAVGTALALLPLAAGVARDLLRGRTGVDVIALLAMTGALLTGEYLAGAVVALMLSGGQVLELFAGSRARREISALADRAPRLAHRRLDGGVETVEVDRVAPGDPLLVKTGEVVPVDGTLSEPAVLDESALTGEAGPVSRAAREPVASGVLNVGPSFAMLASATAAASTYAAIVRLTEAAAASRSPFSRLADRYAMAFLPLTLAVAGGAWLFSGDPDRAVAVLVIATPCPLILAAPVAIVAGMSRAASRGVMVKGGAVLEALARARVVLFDKTGTLTSGIPAVERVVGFGRLPADELLRLAASLDQVSAHVLVPAIVGAASERGLRLAYPSEYEETLGSGIQGSVDGRRVALGKAGWVADGSPDGAVEEVRRAAGAEGALTVFVAVDGRREGALVLRDRIREEAPRAVAELRQAGVDKVLVVTGDHPAAAELVGAAIGADGVLAERRPGEKLAEVRRQAAGGTTVMVGDGINDAPALAAADVGVAMGARGATASSEAAGAVIVVDRLDRLAEAVRIARRSLAIARQSVVAGMTLSGIGMAFAAAGLLPAVQGAFAQEAIDALVILNALRALGGGRNAVPAGAERPSPATASPSDAEPGGRPCTTGSSSPSTRTRASSGW